MRSSSGRSDTVESRWWRVGGTGVFSGSRKFGFVGEFEAVRNDGEVNSSEESQTSELNVPRNGD